MTPTTVKDLQYLPFGWEGNSALNSNTYIAPNETQAKIFLKGATETLINNAKALRKNILICYRTSKNEIKTLKHFYFLASQCYNPKQTYKIENEKTMEILNSTSLNLNEDNKPDISSNFIQIASFIQRQTNIGNSCRINDMKEDVYYYMLNWQPIATDKGDKLEVDKSDVIDDADWLKIDPKRHWDPSFELGNHNYHEELQSRLLKEGYLSDFKYHILQPSGKLSECSTDYYLIVYMNRLCRLAVQNPNNRTIINHDTKYMRLK